MCGVTRFRAKLIKIGNSRGIRLAEPLLKVAWLAVEVEIKAGQKRQKPEARMAFSMK